MLDTDATTIIPFELPGKTPPQQGVVVFSHLRWNFVWQRPQQIISRMAKKHPVIFVEEPMFDSYDRSVRIEITEVQPSVLVHVLHVPASMRREEIATRRAATLREALTAPHFNGVMELVFWYYTPMDMNWSLRATRPKTIVYDCMDELGQFQGAPPNLLLEEKNLLQIADIVFAGGKDLAAKKSKSSRNVHFFGCGVEYEHFAEAAKAGPLPKDMVEIAKPIVGWFGVIDERMDYDLLQKVAEYLPAVSFVLIGPVVKIDPSVLPKAHNIHWLGPRSYSELPSYCRGFDICMMPFALNEATQFINPTKALEYLATGRPVISTPVPDVCSQYQDVIQIVNTPEAFRRAVLDDLTMVPRDRIERGRVLAQASSWEETVASMQGLIAASMAATDAPVRVSRAPIESR